MPSRFITLSLCFFGASILALVFAVVSPRAVDFELGRGLMVVLLALAAALFGAHLLRGRAPQEKLR